jgi:predicted Ser/Thr protein kinase
VNPPVFPSFADYQSALQHPEISFSSNFLRLGLVESDLWGFPRVRSGGFALTYKIELKDNTWATRCFHRAVRDRAIRYAQICQTLEHLALPFFVPTRYFQHGIAVHGKQFPISIVEWIEGESLETFVFHHLDRPEDLKVLCEKFREVCRNMETNHLAHGDLSHRNIMIKAGEIYLIDYDGMYVPALNGRKSSELGNLHFQHPQRSNVDFNEKLDRFSAIVIYLALRALSVDPGLWQKFQSGGEGLLFQRSDFLDPDNSRLFRFLERIPEISRYITSFKQICVSPIDSIPSLEELLAGSNSQPVTLPVLMPEPIKNKPAIPVYHADWLPSILESIGQIVTVTGVVKEVFFGHTEEGGEHIFLNYGNWQDDCFTAVIWGGVLEDINKTRVDMKTWLGKTVSVTGLMSIRNRRPQIQVEAVTDLVLHDPSAKQDSRPAPAQKSIEIPTKPHVEKVSSISDTEIVVPAPFYSPNTKVNLDELFKQGKNDGVENVLNQLYSSEHFKKPRNRKK